MSENRNSFHNDPFLQPSFGSSNQQNSYPFQGPGQSLNQQGSLFGEPNSFQQPSGNLGPFSSQPFGQQPFNNQNSPFGSAGSVPPNPFPQPNVVQNSVNQGGGWSGNQMPPEQKPKKKRKVGKIVGLFLASVIGFAACQAMFDDDVDDEDLCYDDNNDGYCDDNLQRHEPEVYKVSNGKKLYLRITDDDDSFGG